MLKAPQRSEVETTMASNSTRAQTPAPAKQREPSVIYFVGTDKGGLRLTLSTLATVSSTSSS